MTRSNAAHVFVPSKASLGPEKTTIDLCDTAVHSDLDSHYYNFPSDGEPTSSNAFERPRENITKWANGVDDCSDSPQNDESWPSSPIKGETSTSTATYTGKDAYAANVNQHSVASKDMHYPTNTIVPASAMQPTPLGNVDVLFAYCHSKIRLLIFDYDGTLTPIVSDPAAAVPSIMLKQNLQTLASEPRNTVWIVSGRDRAFLEICFGSLKNIGLCAEHGAYIREPLGSEWQDLAAHVDMSWREPVNEIFQRFKDMTKGKTWIENKSVALGWHFRMADFNDGPRKATKCKQQLEAMIKNRWSVDVLDGKCVIEVRPSSINKGAIVQGLLADYGDGSPYNFAICFGDDVTDEDMFRALITMDPHQNRYFTVKIGDPMSPTNARWYLSEPSDVIATIMTLNKAGSTGMWE